MQKPEYVPNVAACLVDPALAFTIFTIGAYIYCGYVIAAGM